MRCRVEVDLSDIDNQKTKASVWELNHKAPKIISVSEYGSSMPKDPDFYIEDFHTHTPILEFIVLNNIKTIDIYGSRVYSTLLFLQNIKILHKLDLKFLVFEDAIVEDVDTYKDDTIVRCSVFKWTETTEEGKDIEEVVKELQNGLNLNMRAYYGTEGKVTDKEVNTRELVEGIYNPYLDKVYVR